MVLGAGRPVHLGGRPDCSGATQWLSASVRTSRVSAADVDASSQ